MSAAIGPGLAPFVSARVGVGGHVEGGLAYTGRGVRVDMRRSFESGHWALSLGAGGTAELYGRQQGTDLPNVDLKQLHGYGVDVPVLAGWDSDNGLYRVWFGPRGGYEHVIVDTLTSEPTSSISSDSQQVRLSANHWFAGGRFWAGDGLQSRPRRDRGAARLPGRERELQRHERHGPRALPHARDCALVDVLASARTARSATFAETATWFARHAARPVLPTTFVMPSRTVHGIPRTAHARATA